MKPLKVLLQGFEGIFSAFGRDSIELDLRSIPSDAAIVALVAPNGGGKTTILENLHPYRVMPSRSTTLGPGGFSYWTQVRGPNALKDLLWEHDGVLYHTVLSFKMTGKTQKSDCYLYRWDTALEAWTPVLLADGTLSDGKSSTYDQCVDEILGPPEKFFTAHFSAQGRKTIASYGAGDIKAILASVLGLENYRDLATKAAQVGKYLRQQLEGLNAELAEARGYDNTAAALVAELDQAERLILAGNDDEALAQANVNGARDALARLLAKRDSQAKNADEVRFLNEQISGVLTKAATSQAGVRAQFEKDQDRHNSEVAGARAAIVSAQSIVHSNDNEWRRLSAVLAEKDLVTQAVARLPDRQRQVKQIEDAIEAHEVTLREAVSLRSKLSAMLVEHAKLTSEGQATSIRIKSLMATAALVDQVPCKGSEMQQACSLMAQANTAMREIPAFEADRAAKRAAYEKLTQEVRELQARITSFDTIERDVRELQRKRKAASDALEDDNRLAARSPLIVDAETRLPVLQESTEQQRQVIAAATERMAQASTALAAIETQKAQAIALIETNRLAEIKMLEDRLEKLEVPVSDAEVDAHQSAVANASAGLVAAQSKARARSEQKVALLGKLEAVRALAARSGQMKEQAERLQEEMAKWKLLEKGLGNDGCVALSIDDAGPEIAAICNGLLSDCFGGRFIVRLDTQRQTQNGDTRETFNVTVFDGHRGTEKSLGDMSGGEEILVNECLTRSVALYASQSAPTNCQTLFTDETDGALDPEAKRTFMQMKRAVLKQGGYDREYFITHTPELWEMADHKIMVAEL